MVPTILFTLLNFNTLVNDTSDLIVPKGSSISVSTPNRSPNNQIREPSSPEDSIGSETRPAIANQLPCERSFNDKRNPLPSVGNNLQFNHKWMNEPVSFDQTKENENKYHSEAFQARTYNEDLYDMWGTEGGKPHKNNIQIQPPTPHNGSQTEISTRREVCGSTLCDMNDIINQKLDFSVLCPQTTSYIYTMGGYVEDSQHFIEKFDIQKGKWEIAGTFVNNRTKFSALPLPNSGSILIMGGKQERSRTATCEEYCLADQVIMPSDIILTSPKSGFGALLLKSIIKFF